MKIDDLISISQKFGSPIYVYDAALIKSQYKKLSDAFSAVENLHIKYAVKALSNINIIKILNSLGSGLDTVSLQEVLIGLEAGVKPNEIIYTPNGVSLDEIEQVVELGVQINIDNLDVLEQFGAQYPKVPVCIRINPHIMAGGNSKISVGHIDSKFGISIHQLPHLLRIVKNTKMNIKKPRKRNQTKIYAKIRPHANFQVNLSTRKIVMALRKFHIFLKLKMLET